MHHYLLFIHTNLNLQLCIYKLNSDQQAPATGPQSGSARKRCSRQTQLCISCSTVDIATQTRTCGENMPGLVPRCLTYITHRRGESGLDWQNTRFHLRHRVRMNEQKPESYSMWTLTMLMSLSTLFSMFLKTNHNSIVWLSTLAGMLKTSHLLDRCSHK